MKIQSFGSLTGIVRFYLFALFDSRFVALRIQNYQFQETVQVLTENCWLDMQNTAQIIPASGFSDCQQQCLPMKVICQLSWSRVSFSVPIHFLQTK